MAEDIARLETAQQRLLQAMDHAATAVSSIEAGNATEAQDTCNKFLDAIQESQTILLEVATKQQSPLPYQLDASVARLEAAAAECEAQAAKLAQQQGHNNNPS